MSSLATPATSWQWRPDVLEFAARHGLESYLDPFLEATRQVFPTAKVLRVFPEVDVSLPDIEYLVFDLEVPIADVPEFVPALHRWDDELCQIVPKPLRLLFCLDLHRVD